MSYLFSEISEGLRTAISHFAMPTGQGKIIGIIFMVTEIGTQLFACHFQCVQFLLILRQLMFIIGEVVISS